MAFVAGGCAARVEGTAFRQPPVSTLEDAALDEFVRRYHHGEDYYGPGPSSGAGGPFQLYASEGWPLHLSDSEESPQADRSRPARTFGWVTTLALVDDHLRARAS